MKHAIVVDSNANHRSTLMQQLSQSEYNSVFQFKNLTEAHNKLLTLSFFSGVIVFTVEGDTNAFAEFLRYTRFKHPNLAVIAVLDSLSLDQMRSLISMGVDHVLIRPFNSLQLIAKIAAAESFRNKVISEIQDAPDSNFFEAIVEKITDKYFKVYLRGWLSENCELPTFRNSVDGATLFIDCEQMKGINSIGTRSWMLWFKALLAKGFNHFEFDNIHPPILQQTSSVQGFIPHGSVVNSFYLYYFCDELEEEKEVRLAFGRNYGSSQMRVPESIKDVRGNREYVFALEESARKLLNFYQGNIEFVPGSNS